MLSTPVIGEQQVADFRRDGWVALRGAFDAAAASAGPPRRIPSVVALGPTGELAWFQRLRADMRDGVPIVSAHDQALRALAIDASGASADVIVSAEGRPGDAAPLWSRPEAGEPGFQGLPMLPGGTATTGWIGRLDARTGRLQAATWVYRVAATPNPAIMRSGRLACFVDERLAAGVAQPAQLDAGRLAVSATGSVAVAGVGFGLATTPDGLQDSGAPFTRDAARFVRIYDRALAELLYATAIGPVPPPPDGQLGGDIELSDMAFTADGHLLVVGHQRRRDADGDGADDGAQLPQLDPLPWAAADWPAEQRTPRSTRAFVLRLVPDPTCGLR